MRAATAGKPRAGLGAIDMALVVLFLLGLYSGYELRLTPTVPIPSTLSGIAGAVLLWRRRDMIAANHVAALMIVVAVYLVAVFSATNDLFLAKRVLGWVQLTYSLVLGYALFLTVLVAGRRQLALLLLTLCLVIVIGCVLENHTALRQVSDAVRERIYSFGVYASDLRDELLYGRVRPKLFTSEPSAVTFAYTLFGFAWLVVSTWRWKLPVYLGLVAAGMVAMPGPTLLLMLALLVPYYLLLAPGDAHPSYDRTAHWLKAGVLSVLCVAAFAALAGAVYSERVAQIFRGEDPSFFYRVIGPALVAFDIAGRYPWAGAGLTGEAFIADTVLDVFVRSSHFSAAWRFDRVAEVLTNYFWLHWIYLGMVWGAIALAALTAWLRVLLPFDTLFCWMVWAILGQASGSYVGPKCWACLLLALGLAAKLRQEPAWRRRATVRPAAGAVWGPAVGADGMRPSGMRP